MALGQKKPLSEKQVKLLKRILAAEKNKRDICLLCVQLDTMLRSSDVLNLKVSDILTCKGAVKDEITVQQKKTGKTVSGILQDDTRAFLQAYIEDSGKKPGDFLFSSKKRAGHQRLTAMGHHKIVKRWFKMLDVDPSEYATHSLRRTKSSILYEKTQNIAAIAELLGHSSASATIRYLGITRDKSLELSRSITL